MTFDQRLQELDINLPIPAVPVAAYVPFVRHGALIYLSGQLPFDPSGKVIGGMLGSNLTIETGQQAARSCAINLLAQLAAACGGSLNMVERIVRLGVFVAATPEFTDIPKVANGASELIELVFGEQGRHARSAVGVASLPLGAAVEIDAIIALQAQS